MIECVLEKAKQILWLIKQLHKKEHKQNQEHFILCRGCEDAFEQYYQF